MICICIHSHVVYTKYYEYLLLLLFISQFRMQIRTLKYYTLYIILYIIHYTLYIIQELFSTDTCTADNLQNSQLSFLRVAQSPID